MPFNGSGGFVSLGGATFPAVPGTTILASQYNDQLNDIFNGLGQVVTRSGQSPWTANLPAGAFKITSLAVGSANGDSVAFGQAAVTFGTVTAAITGHSSLDLALTGGIMTGLIQSSNAVNEAFRMNHNAGFISGYESTGVTRSGYIQFNSGGNTSIAGETATGIITLYTNAQERLRLDSVGNVGIGGVSAGARLDLITAAGDPYLRITNGTVQAYMQANGSTGVAALGSLSNHAVTILTNSIERMRLTAAGLVGIAKTPTLGTLDVAGTGVFTSANSSTVVALSGGNALFASFAVGRAAAENYFAAVGQVGNFFTGTLVGDGAVSAINNLWLGTPSAASVNVTTNGSTRFIVDSVGNLGVSRAPAANVRLDILGIGNAVGYGLNNELRISSNNATVSTIYSWNQIQSSGALAIGAGGAQSLAVNTTGTLDLTQGSGKLLMGGAITRFESAERAAGTGTFVDTVAHGGPRKPDLAWTVLRCKTAELGYSIGDETEVVTTSGTADAETNTSATNVGLSYNRTGNMVVLNKTTGVQANITTANWRIVYYCIWL